MKEHVRSKLSLNGLIKAALRACIEGSMHGSVMKGAAMLRGSSIIGNNLSFIHFNAPTGLLQRKCSCQGHLSTSAAWPHHWPQAMKGMCTMRPHPLVWRALMVSCLRLQSPSQIVLASAREFTQSAPFQAAEYGFMYLRECLAH